MKIEIKLNEEDKQEAIEDWITNKYTELLKGGKIVEIYPALGEVMIYTENEYETK